MKAIRIGEVILQEYRVEDFIASGGMAAVYRVWDLKRNVPLAMKVLNPDLAEDPSLLKRFQREAKALQELTHPHIVPFYGLKQTDDLFFLLEKYIDGVTLKDYLQKYRGRAMPFVEVMRFFNPITAALGYAHARGVIHCDVKPGNVMIDQGGMVYLTDFGIARHADSSFTTLPDLGTPAYMAPEQIRGEPVTPATDVYALGVMLYEMLTGVRMFRVKDRGSSTPGSTEKEQIRQAHLHQPPPDPRQYNPGLPPALVEVLLRAVDKNPAARYQGARELYEAVLAAVGGSAVIPAQDPQPQQPQPEPTSPPAAGKGIFFAGAGIILIVLMFLFLKPGPPGVVPTPVTPPTLTPIAASTGEPIASLPGGLAIPPTVDPAAAPAGVPEEATPAPVSEPTANPVEKPAQVIPQPQPARVVQLPTPELYTPLKGCAQSHIRQGNFVMVNSAAGTISLRKTADTHPSNNIKKKLKYGTVMKVTAKPACSYGWIMWKVKTTDGDTGWLPESDGKAWWLDVLMGQKACPQAPVSRLVVNMDASIAKSPGLPNNVRKDPGVNGQRIGQLLAGTRIKILGGPECADGYVWWFVTSEHGLQGWTVEGDSSDIYLVPGAP